MTLSDLLPPEPEPDAIYDAFAGWVEGRGIELYPAQQEALIEIVSGANVILSTPTGSGKSLVATGAHFAALARDGVTFYTAPIKALVSEKFFAAVEIFGPDDDITMFEYVKRSNRETGPALVGIELGAPEDLAPLLARMEAAPPRPARPPARR